MLGNRLGWFLAAILVLTVAAAVALVYAISSRRTEPTEFSGDPANLAEIHLPIDPHGLLPLPPRDGDAGDLYWQAVVDYRANPEPYNRQAASESFNLAAAAGLVGVKSAIDAAEYRRAGIFAGRVDAAVGYGSPPAVVALQQVGAILAAMGTEYAVRRDDRNAKRYLHAEFFLGMRLYDERVTRQQLSTALGMMAHAATALRPIAVYEDDKTLAVRLNDYVKAQRDYAVDVIAPMARVVTSVDPSVHPRHVGDVFVLAHKSAERVWRVESTLKLGMYRYNTNTAGDRRAAIRDIRQLMTDPDPAVAAAAVAAKELTLESYRTISAK